MHVNDKPEGKFLCAEIIKLCTSGMYNTLFLMGCFFVVVFVSPLLGGVVFPYLVIQGNSRTILLLFT